MLYVAMLNAKMTESSMCTVHSEVTFQHYKICSFKHIFIDELHITFFFTIQYNIGFRNKRNAYINPFPKIFSCQYIAEILLKLVLNTINLTYL